MFFLELFDYNQCRKKEERGGQKAAEGRKSRENSGQYLK